ncbi:MAG TPA: AtpZ/AtpI family protein [Candidatus Limnocylindria bacterium]|jgi:F0F1-type ATP synthase assembly protein I
MNNNWGIALDLGIRLGASVMIGFFVGLALDSLLGTRPLMILVGTAFGVAAAMYTIWDVARRAMRK